MKRILIIALLLPTLVFGQKPIKPNLNKTLNLWKQGKLDEAKEMIDVATTYEKTMDDGKTWYYRGLIYATLDTTSNEAFKSLATDPLKTAVESFAKADQLQTKAGSDYFLPPDATTTLPITKTQQCQQLADFYLNEGITFIQQDEPDYGASITSLEKSIAVFEGNVKPYNNDTLTYFVLSLSAMNAEQYEKAIAAADKYYEKGGKTKDAYLIQYQIYTGPMEDKEKALAVVRNARKLFPTNADFPRMEIGLLIDMNKVDEAKAGLEKAVKESPDDKVLHFYLAYTNAQLKNNAEAEKHYREALRIDPSYFEAQYYLSQLYLIEVDALTKQINNLGISAADDKKKRELFQARVKACEKAIPYLEKTESMKAPNTETQIEVLEKLQMMYYYVADDVKDAVVKKKLKALGAEVD